MNTDLPAPRLLPSSAPSNDGFASRCVVITRPVGTAAGMARRVRAQGGVPLLLPGLSLRAASDPVATRAALHTGLGAELLVFTSPAAVRYAARLLPLLSAATVLAVGRGTARVLRHYGVANVLAPAQQDSEGLLDLAPAQQLRGRRVTLIGAPGGRGVLRTQLVARGALLSEVQVYWRAPPRLDRRHFDALQRLPSSALVLLSSAEALHNLSQQLPERALTGLLAATAVVSSQRLADAAIAAGFGRVVLAASALTVDLLDMVRPLQGDLG